MKKSSPSFAERLKSARRTRGLSQEDLAKKAEMPASSVAHFEIDSRKPSFDSLRRLARALSVTTDYLLGLTENPSLPGPSEPMYRNASKLSLEDRKLAENIVRMLANRDNS